MAGDEEVQLIYGPLLSAKGNGLRDETSDLISISEREFAPAPPRHLKEDTEGRTLQETHAARQRFLDDLNNYVPLGSIRAPVHEHFSSTKTWEEQGPNGPVVFKQFTRGFNQLQVLHLEGWIRIFAKRHKDHNHECTIRIYLLPDDVGRRWVDRDCGPNHLLRKHLRILMEEVIDFSTEAWEGDYNGPPIRPLGCCFTDPDRDDLLFYIFNTISSPVLDDTLVECRFSRDAIACLLDSSGGVAGLVTPLYPYQRRSAATIIRREVKPARTLDPRLEAFEGPIGNTLHYDTETAILLRDKRTYEEARGGILAETMGLGKTLICLAAILATKGHWPRIPPEFSTNQYPRRHKTGTLVEMAAAAIARQQIPWRVHFQDLANSDQDNETCVSILDKTIGSYTIVPQPKNHTRRPSADLKEKVIRLCPVTLVVVPLNLVHHWRNEMALHLEKDALKVAIITTMDSQMPSEDEIIVSDVLLIAKPRFEREMKPIDASYESPLKNLHFLRIIVDEGHDFGSAGAGSNAIWALQRLHVDRRWIVSGTPTTGLLGVEVGLAAKETSDGAVVSASAANATLVKDRTGDTQERMQERKDLERLGRIVSDFLQLRPWANSKGDDPASWQKYIMPRKDGSRKLRSLRSILEGLVVRHRIEDVEKDVQLPPLHNRIVTISPTWSDKLSLNLFVLNLCVNAVTSQRIDQDYMFDRRNRGTLITLIANLRQAGFYWTGHQPAGVSKTLELAQKYIKEHFSSPQPVRGNDMELLVQALSIGKAALLSESWKILSELNELGVYVEEFPTEARKAWSPIDTDEQSELLLVTATHLAEAQKFVDSRLYAPDPAKGLAETGKKVLRSTLDAPIKHKHGQMSPTGAADELKLLNKHTISRSKVGRSPKRNKRAILRLDQDSPMSKQDLPSPTPAIRRNTKNQAGALIPVGSQLAQTKIRGFASAKLTYLMNQIIALHQSEKIIVFYEGNHIAYYIAQALELIDIRFLIYTGSLTERRKAAYITTFNATNNFPVMLMDLSQAAHGLHLASASRIFFVNPVWQPKVEAQAIKRAHRIGQTKPVYVETLVLQDTFEDKMLSRRKTMSAEEHQRAEKSLLDDDKMKQIIQNASFIPMSIEQIDDSLPFAQLREPQQLFGRIGSGSKNPGNPDADLIFPGEVLAQKEESTLNVDDFPSSAQDDAASPISRIEPERLVSGPNAKKKGVSFSVVEEDTVHETFASRQSLKRPAPDPPTPAPRKRTVTYELDGENEERKHAASRNVWSQCSLSGGVAVKDSGKTNAPESYPTPPSE